MIRRAQVGCRGLRAVVVAGFLAGCAVGPDYVPPRTELPDLWEQELSRGLVDGKADLRTWWTALDDAELDRLIARATEGNLDLRQAVARIREARANLGIASGELLPEVDAIGSVEQQPDQQPGRRRRWRRRSRAPTPCTRSGSMRPGRSTSGAGSGATSNPRTPVSGPRSRTIATPWSCSTRTSRATTSRCAPCRRGSSPRSTTSGRSASALQLTVDRNRAGLAPDLDVRQAELNLATTEAFVPPCAARSPRRSIVWRCCSASIRATCRNEFARRRRRSRSRRRRSWSACRRSCCASARTSAAPSAQLAAQTAQIGVATAELYPQFTPVRRVRVRIVLVRQLDREAGAQLLVRAGVPLEHLRCRPHPQQHRGAGRAHRAGAGRLRADGARRGRGRRERDCGLRSGAGPARVVATLGRRGARIGAAGRDPVPDRAHRLPERARHPALAVPAGGRAGRERGPGHPEPDPDLSRARRRLGARGGEEQARGSEGVS